MTDDTIYYDEALDFIKKFLQLTAKDYINPALRFSRLSSERQSWETAREFLIGETAIPWGNFTLSYEDMCQILNLDADWFHTQLETEKIEKAYKFLGRKRKKKKDLMSIVCFTHCCSPKLATTLRPKLKQTGLSPVLSPIGPVEFYQDIEPAQLENMTPELESQLLEKRDIIRRQIDRHSLLLSRADLMLVIWTAGVNEYQVLMDIITAYRNYLPVFMVLLDDGPPIDMEILACCRTATVGSEAIPKMLDILKEFIGTGRAQIARNVRPKMADLLRER